MSTLTDDRVELQVLEAPRYRRAPVLAAFAAELRRRRPGPNDRVAVLLQLADSAGAELPWRSRPVEPCPAGRVAGADDSYVEALAGTVAGLLRELPETWFEFEGHHLPVRVEGIALAIEKDG
jgi:hypothetical protein